MTKNVVTYQVYSRLVAVRNRLGERIRQARLGQWHRWRDSKQLIYNVEAAIKYVTGKMINDHIGGIVAVRPVANGVPQPEYTKIFQAKWGNDDKPFLRFDGVAGEYWKRRVTSGLLKKLNAIYPL